LKSPDFEKEVKLAGTRDKLDKIRQTVKQYLSNKGSRGRKALDKSVVNLKEAAEKLSNTISSSMAEMINVLEQCNNLYTGMSERKEYLLDVCAQGGAECLNEKGAKHVGCCCAVNPVSLKPGATLRIQASDSASLSSYGSGRRLDRQLTASTPGEGEVDICASSWTRARPKVLELLGGVDKSSGGPLKEYNDDLKNEYGEYYCPVFEGPWSRPVTSGGDRQTSGNVNEPNETDTASGCSVSFAATILTILLLVPARGS